MPSKELREVLQLIRERVSKDPQPIETMRAEFEMNAKIFKVDEEVRFEAVRIGRLEAEWVILPESADRRVLLYLHGGGYVMGSINTHREMVSRICRAGAARGLIAAYRLAPEHPYPAALEDAVSAYQWLLDGGWDPRRMAVAGDSAGAGLAIAALVTLREKGRPLPAACVCISPWVDLEGRGESIVTKADVDPIVQPEGILFMAETYLGGADPRTPLAAPLYADLKGLPPMLIQVGTSEILLDDAKRLAAHAKEAGVEITLEIWEQMFHIWHFFASLLPEGREAINHIGQFIRRHTGS
jgi:epsilon-lactone hydrolase